MDKLAKIQGPAGDGDDKGEDEGDNSQDDGASDAELQKPAQRVMLGRFAAKKQAEQVAAAKENEEVKKSDDEADDLLAKLAEKHEAETKEYMTNM